MNNYLYLILILIACFMAATAILYEQLSEMHFYVDHIGRELGE